MKRLIIPDDFSQSKPEPLSAYPNPAVDKLFIKTREELNNAMIEIVDMNGRSITRKDYTLLEDGCIIELDLDNLRLTDGLYYLHLSADHGINQFIKINRQ